MEPPLKKFLHELTELASIHVYLYEALQGHPDYSIAGLKKPKNTNKEKPAGRGLALKMQTQSRIIVTRLFQLHMIVAFEIFLSSTLEFIFRIDERTLNAYADKKVKDILLATSLEDLKGSVIEKLVHDIMFLAVEETVERIRKNHGVILLRPHEIAYVRYIFAFRNLWLHNGGIVDRNFLRVTRSDQQHGTEVRKLPISQLFQTLKDIAVAIDNRIKNHFNRDA